MKYYICLLIAVCSLPYSSTHSGEGAHTGNGGGSSEANIVYAWQNVEKFIDVALKSNSIDLAKDESNLLRKITSSLDKERSELNLIFKSGKKHPELFELDDQGKARIAMTGDFVGDTIYFNYDRLYPKDDFGISQPISVIRAVGYLVHEFGHHHNIKDHAYLDLLGTKVMMASRGMIKKVDLSEYQRPFIDITAYNKNLNFIDVLRTRSGLGGNQVLSDLILSDSTKLINLTDELNKKLLCERVNTPKLMYTFFNNLHWGDLEPYNTSSKTQRITLKGNLNWVCKSARPFSSVNLRMHSSFELDLYFKVKRKGAMANFPMGDRTERTWPRHEEYELNFKEQKLFFTKCRYENNFGMSGQCEDLAY
jgi:hypothetical protein